ncbi:xylose isomerase-like protein [Panaeolus papilionaceus]|nr:xylose isomerase-like protein [Panaeolus papilionaceus]
MLLRSLHHRLVLSASVRLLTLRNSGPMPPKRKISSIKPEEGASMKRTRRQQAIERDDTLIVSSVQEKAGVERKATPNTRKGKGKTLDNEVSLPGIQRTDTFKVAETEASCSCEEDAEPVAKTKRKAKVKGVDLSNPLPRQIKSPWKVGAHVSSAGGVENAVLNAVAIGATSFALFLKSQRKWESPSLSDESVSQFKSNMKQYGYSSSHVLPHGSYLINLANPDLTKRQKSYDCFLDDLKRCELLGLELYNFHPGSTLGEPLDTAVGYISQCINDAHAATNTVIVVLENMAGAGNIIGSDFSHLASIIELVKDKSRVGVCIDTCHAFAAGYDIRTPEGWESTMKKFNEVVGLKYLRGMHINDSKTDFNSKRDRHESIGLGYLGLQAFKHIVNDPRTQNLPLVLETPSFEQPRDVWGKEIEVLQRISGCTPPTTSQPPSPNAEPADKSSSQDDNELEDYVEEIRKAVKIAEKNEKKPGGAKAKKSVRKRKTGTEEDGDDNEEGGELAETQETENGDETPAKKARKGSSKKATPRKWRSKKILEDHEE